MMHPPRQMVAISPKFKFHLKLWLAAPSSSIPWA
jgi:hypothetical protein